MKITKNKLNWLAKEIVELKKFQYRNELGGKDMPALSNSIAVMEKAFWFKYNNFKR